MISAQYSIPEESGKPVVVLVAKPSLLRGWMKQSLTGTYRLLVFAGNENTRDFIRTARCIDVLITELDLGVATFGGCNIARDVKDRFPDSKIFVFANAESDDYRLMILRSMKTVRFLRKPLDAVFLSRHVKSALANDLEAPGETR
ncbi:hypothetical protein WDW86_11360 [Bdellovibrionota bacterium FG-2]